MNKSLQWLIGLSVLLVAVALVVSMLTPLFLSQLGWQASGPLMAMGHPMFGGRGMMSFNFPRMGLQMMGLPVLVLALLVAGGAWVVRTLRPAQPLTASSPAAAPAPTTPCAHCQQPLHPNWKVCPYCEEKV